VEPELRDRLVRVETRQEHQGDLIEEVRGDVKKLLAAIEQGRGVLSFFRTMPGLLVALVSVAGFLLAVVK
jgi:hypothetical protein